MDDSQIEVMREKFLTAAKDEGAESGEPEKSEDAKAEKPNDTQEKPPEEEVIKIPKKQYESEIEYVKGKQANDIGQLRKTVEHQNAIIAELSKREEKEKKAALELSDEDIKNMYFDDPEKAVNLILEKREQKKKSEISNAEQLKIQKAMSLESEFLEKHPDYSVKEEKYVIPFLKEVVGLSDVEINNFKQAKFYNAADNPGQLERLLYDAEKHNETKELRAEVEALRKSKGEIVDKITSPKKTPLITPTTQNTGSADEFHELTAHELTELSDTEVREYAKKFSEHLSRKKK